jgi:predicted MFS family arabinose efflux permease
MIRHQIAAALGLMALGVAGVIANWVRGEVVFALLWAALLVLASIVLALALLLNPGSGDE